MSRCRMPIRASRRRALRDLDAVIEDLRDRQRAAGEARRKRLARQVLHDQEVEAVGVTDVVQHADVRMADRGDGAGFALESFARVVLGDACRQNLDGDRAIGARVARLATSPTPPTPRRDTTRYGPIRLPTRSGEKTASVGERRRRLEKLARLVMRGQ